MMARRKTELLRTLAALLLLCALAACDDPEAQTQEYIERGRQFFEAGELDKAQLDFKSALQIDPDAADAHLYLARIAEARGYWTAAARSYMNAADVSGEVEPVLQAGQLHIVRNDPTKALELADKILEALPNNHAAGHLRAVALAGTGRIEEARQLAMALDPPSAADPIAAVTAARVHVLRGDPDLAAAILEGVASGEPVAAPALRTLARIQETQEELEAAVATWRRLAAIEPDRTDPIAAIAMLEVRLGRPESAEQDLRAAIEARPDDVERRRLLVRLLESVHGTEVAAAELAQIIEEMPDAPELRVAFGDLRARSGAVEDAQQSYEEAIASDPESGAAAAAHYRLATIHYEHGTPADAAAHVAQILRIDSFNHAGLVLRARIALARGDTGQALSDLQIVKRRQPDSPEILILLAEAHGAAARSDAAHQRLHEREAMEVFRHLAEVAPDNRMASLAVVRGLDNLGRREAALEAAGRHLERWPTDPVVLEITVRIHAGRRNWTAAADAVRRILEAYPEDPRGPLLTGELARAQGDTEAAIAAYEHAVAMAPGAPGPISILAMALVDDGEPERALEVVAAGLEANPESAAVRDLEGRLLLGFGRTDEAEAAFRQAIALAPELDAPRVSLARLAYQRGDAAGAAALLEEGLLQAPESVPLRLALAETRMHAGDLDAAIDLYREVLARDATNDLATNNLATLLVDHKGDRKSLEEALALTERLELSDDASHLDTRGWAKVRIGRTVEGVRLLERARKRDPDRPTIRYHLAFARHKLGDDDRAKTLLEELRADAPEILGTEEAQKLLADVGLGDATEGSTDTGETSP